METILIAILAAWAVYEWRHVLFTPMTLLILALGLPTLWFWLAPVL